MTARWGMRHQGVPWLVVIQVTGIGSPLPNIALYQIDKWYTYVFYSSIIPSHGRN